MEATGSGSALRKVPIGLRRSCGSVGDRPMSVARAWPVTVKIGVGFRDEGHLSYYAPVRCGAKKEEKRKMKLVTGLEKDLSALYSMQFGVDQAEGLAGEVKGKIVSEAANTLLAQLTLLKAEAKELKKKRKQEKAAKKAAKMKDESSSSSSESSSDGECEAVVKMSSLRSLNNEKRTEPTSTADPIAALQTEEVIQIAKGPIAALQTKEVIQIAKDEIEAAFSREVEVKPMEKIEVCMGGKCRKSGAAELKAEFERVVGVEAVVVGCKCMGKCRDGPNVRVVNESSVEEERMNPLCIGVGVEDVGSIVDSFFGEKKSDDLGLLAA